MDNHEQGRRRGRTVALCAGMVSLLTGAGGALADRPVAGSLTADRLKLPSGPSSVRGLADEPSVDAFFAQLRYQVPIELPGGFGGLAPQLSLTYAGTVGNGPLGIGWALDQAKIERSTRLGVPTFTDADELEISGIAAGRLIAIAADDYRVEGMGQTVRVKRVDGGFEVDDGKGTHYRLGASALSRQDRDPTHTLGWRVESQTNAMGEQIQYSYVHDGGQIYLASVTWGPGGVYRADLSYEARGDAATSFRGGFSVVTARRLHAIQVTANGIERRTYTMTYEPIFPVGTFPVSRLSSVSSTGVAGQGAWPALTFSYAVPAAPAITPIAGIGTWRLNGNGTTLVDLDGDGAVDLLQAAAGGHSYLTNQNGTFGGLQTLTGNTQPLSQLQLQDIDGDARPELLAENASGWTVWKFSKTAWVQQPGTWPGSQGLALRNPAATRYADLNGDGLVDAIQWNNDGLNVHFATRTGLAAGKPVERIGGAVVPTEQGRFVDTNGDGLDDFLVVATDRLDVYLGHGDGTFEPATAVHYPFDGTVTNVADIELADLDRDGLIDLLKIEQGTVRWFRGLADGTFSTAAVTLNNPEPLVPNVVVAVADTNGNGSQDVVWSSNTGMWRLDMAGTTTAGMLVRVQNGLGLDVTFDYQSSHALSVAAQANGGTPWAHNVPIAMPVPVQKTTALGPGEVTRRVSYGVSDGLWDAVEQRFAGFLTTTVTTWGATAAQTSRVTTRYVSGLTTNRVARGRPSQESVQDGSNKVISITSNTWTSMAIDGLPDLPLLHRPILTKRTVLYMEGATPRSSEVAYQYDKLGRTSHAADSGRIDLTGDESVKDTTYADDDVTWVRDQLCEEKVSGTDGTVVSDTQYLFGDAGAAPLPLCTVGKGWPRVTQALLASESRFVPSEQRTYDAHGNPITIITNGVERRFVYDPSGLFVLEEHVTKPSGGELVWQATWDPTLGEMATMTDPNGHTVQLGHDALGRLTSTAIDGHAPHQVIEYDLTPPFPRTTVWDYDGALASVVAKPAGWTAGAGWRQTVEVRNGLGEVRYRAQRVAEAQWIISGYHEVDPNGRVVFAGRPVYATQLEQPARPDKIVGDTLVYDPLGRLIEQDLPTGARRTSSYVAFERTTQEADLAPVHSELDGQGRAILTERSLPDGTHEIVRATYDPAGRLTQMTLSGGTVTRSFTYDTLGRLRQSTDPDLGIRTLAWDDGNRLTRETNAASQTIQYSYDALGRLITRDAGSVYRYHYDDARPGVTTATNLSGRLAWIEEPTGGVELSYDPLGRTSVTRRQIDTRVSEVTTSYAASGLVLGRSYDDGFALTYRYDPAGRPTAVGDLWQVLDQDANGQPLHETAQNGVDTRYGRDVLGLTSQVTVRDVSGATIYDVAAQRNAWTSITTVTDLDGAGLDHGAQFGYDGFARLTSAVVGSGAASLSFGYSYDVLHNMTSRTATPAGAVGALFGTYRYGEAGHGPRQLTSIADVTGHPTHTFNYDPAGRQVTEDDLAMTYDPTDRLMRVDGLPGGAVVHAYGYDGARVKTTAPDGSVSYFYGEGTADRNGAREHDVTVGDRVVARVTMPTPAAPATAQAGRVTAVLGAVVTIGPWGLALGALCLALAGVRRPLRRRAASAGMLGLVLATACSPPGVGASRDTLTAAPRAIFLHTGFGAGPVLFTDAAGKLLEERRYEPFGAPIDARMQTTTGYVVGNPDVVTRDLNELNKRTEAATGWSDHGARWMAPETGRWLTPDPPVEGPSAKFMLQPWALHPYQYVDQNPVAYWDPDGREPAVDSSAHVIAVTTFDAVFLKGSETVDLVNGERFSSIGATSPALGVSFSGGLVVPNPGNTAKDVILGFSAGFSVEMPVAGAGLSMSVNPSGYIITLDGGIGIGGPSASMTYTSEDNFDMQRLQQQIEEARTPLVPQLDLAFSGESTGAMSSRSTAQVEAPPGAPAPDRVVTPRASFAPAPSVPTPQECWTMGPPP